MRHLTCNDDVEVIGGVMLSFVDNIQAGEIKPILAKHGLDSIDPGTWYKCQRWLTVLNELSADSNMTANYVAIGMRIAEHVKLPPQLADATIDVILQKWGDIYKMQHRGSEIGGKGVEKVGDKQYRAVITDLYPDDMSYGSVYGFCRRFLPTGTPFTIEYEDLENRRDTNGAPETVILIGWE